jgi:hypothetical protein
MAEIEAKIVTTDKEEKDRASLYKYIPKRFSKDKGECKVMRKVVNKEGKTEAVLEPLIIVDNGETDKVKLANREAV